VIAIVSPQMTALSVSGNDTAFENLYRRTTQWLGLLAWPGCAMFVLHGDKLLLAWAGERALAETYAPILQLYAVGNTLLAVSAVAFVAQFARGELRLHLVGSSLFLIGLMVSVFEFVPRFGAIGAASCWFAVNLAYFFIWLPVTHYLRGPVGFTRWIWSDVLPLALSSFACAITGWAFEWSEHRLLLAVQLLLLGVLSFCAAACGSSWVRGLLIGFFRIQRTPAANSRQDQKDKQTNRKKQ
jgi:O-antigen/teichoic acid export membrane protein